MPKFDFIPSICLHAKGCSIFLDDAEYKELINNQGIITNYFYVEETTWQPLKMRNLMVVFTVSENGGKKIIKFVQDENEVTFHWEDVLHFWDLIPLLNFRIEALMSEMFALFYRNLITGVCKVEGNSLEIIRRVISPLYNSENVLCMFECLLYYPDRVKSDVELNKLAMQV